MATIKFEQILALQILPVHFNISIVLFAFDIFRKLSFFFFNIAKINCFLGDFCSKHFASYTLFQAELLSICSISTYIANIIVFRIFLVEGEAHPLK